MGRQDLGIRERFGRDLFSVSELFHENTKLSRAPSGRVLGAQEMTPTQSELNFAQLHPAKRYSTAPKTHLPHGLPPLAMPVEQVIRARHSVREFSGAAISLEQLSYILALSYGSTGEVPLSDGTTARRRRAVPSAGALYPIEIYSIVLQVNGLQGGLYHYAPGEHLLEGLQLRDLRSAIKNAVLYPEVVEMASAVLLLVAIFQRTRFKYGERGYRFVLLDAGHVAQNMYLVATALELGAVAIGGFLDDDLNRMLDINGVDEAVVYVIVLGRV